MKKQALVLALVLAACADVPAYSEQGLMPAPSDDPDFATDATYAADGDAWSGNPVRVDPGAPIRAEGFEPGILPAEWLNHVLGVHGDWINWLETERDRLHDYTRQDLGAAGRSIYVAATQGAPAYSGGSPTWHSGSGGYMESLVQPGQIVWGLAAGAPLPLDCVVTGVRAFVQPGAARGAGSRMLLQVYRQAASGLGLTSVGSVEDDGATGVQTLSVTGLNIPLGSDASGVYGYTNLAAQVFLSSGTGAGTDKVFLLEVIVAPISIR